MKLFKRVLQMHGIRSLTQTDGTKQKVKKVISNSSVETVEILKK